jgi:hypothetical protein
MPKITYAHCDRPLVHEADRLRRIVRDGSIQYAIFDSIVFACDGPPESAEIAGRYFRAVRQIGAGSLHVAHITKGENADKKPFGSAFWHNGARATWYAQVAEGSREEDTLQVGFFCRKMNLGRLRPPISYRIKFGEECTRFERAAVADNPDLAGQLSVRQRMYALLQKKGAAAVDQISEEIDADKATVHKTIRRHTEMFTILDGGRVGLSDRRPA